MEIKNGKRTNTLYVWTVYCHKSLVRDLLKPLDHKLKGILKDKTIAYAKKKNIPLATAILSGYIDELNKHPELCLPSSDDEIFGPARKRGKKPTARQLAEEDLVCKFETSVYSRDVFVYGSYQGDDRNFYSIEDLKKFKELGKASVPPELNQCIHYYEGAHVDDRHSRLYSLVPGDNPFIGSKDGPFFLNDKISFGGYGKGNLNEDYLQGFRKFNHSGDRWEENFFAWKTLFGKVKVARHIPRRLCRRDRKTGMLNTYICKGVSFGNFPAGDW